MKTKLYIVTLAVSFFSVMPLAQAKGLNFSDLSGLKASKIINFDKISIASVLRPVSFNDIREKAEYATQVSVVYLENSQLADCYRAQPFLFGILTLFIAVSLGAIGFIFHLIHNDPRFY